MMPRRLDGRNVRALIPSRGIGAAIGLTAALIGTRYIEAQLFGVTPPIR